MEDADGLKQGVEATGSWQQGWGRARGYKGYLLPADRRDRRECRELNSLDKLKNVQRKAQEKQLPLER